MIQRKQTLFLFLALVAAVACLMLPIGYFEPEGMGAFHRMTNWFILNPQNGGKEMMLLSFILLAACLLTFGAIFTYKNRILQARLCVASIVALLLWYAVYAMYAFFFAPDDMAFHFAFAALFPLVGIVFNIMARTRIIADEKLVRAVDRIR